MRITVSSTTPPFLFIGLFIEIPKIPLPPDDLVTNIVLDTKEHGPLRKYALDFNPPMRYGSILMIEAAGSYDEKDGRYYLTNRDRMVAEIEPAYNEWARQQGGFDDNDDNDDEGGVQEAREVVVDLVGPPSWDNVHVPAEIGEQMCFDHQEILIRSVKARERECSCR